MLVTTKGIVLRAIKYGESSMITDIYTHQFGLRSYIISGVRSKRSKTKASLLQILSIVQVVVYDKGGKSLGRIKEINSDYVFTSIPFDIRKGTIALFLTEVIRKAVREEEQNESLFDFLRNRIIHLDTTNQAVGLVPSKFMIDLSKYLGFEPMDNYSSTANKFNLQEGQFSTSLNAQHGMNEAESQLLFQLLKAPEEEYQSITCDKIVRTNLIEALIKYYSFHVEKFSKLNAYEVLKTVMS